MGSPDRKQTSRRVPVLLPYPFPGPFDYRVPAEMTVQPGDVVLVPLNRREEIGVVWDGVPDPRVKCPGAGSSRAGCMQGGTGCAGAVRRTATAGAAGDGHQ